LGNRRPIEWLVPGITLAAASDIGREIVEASIRAADRTIALVDNANANVAREAGPAMGLGKPVGLGMLRPMPAWAQQGALEGQWCKRC
jgi:nucleoside 2-deoxyribosyltransferase